MLHSTELLLEGVAWLTCEVGLPTLIKAIIPMLLSIESLASILHDSLTHGDGLCDTHPSK